MKKRLLSLFCGALAMGAMLWIATPQAQAIKAFKTEFTAKYVKPDSQDPKEKAFAEAVAAAKCNVCHEGRSKKNRNAYGKALDELLDRKTDKRNPEKIQAALKTVAGKKSDPNDADSPTFGELISAGKLPGGDPK